MLEKDFVPNTVNIPRTLHRRAKVAAALEGVTLQAWIIESMRLRVTVTRMETIIGRIYHNSLVLFPQSQLGERWQELHDLLYPIKTAKTDFKNPMYVETSWGELIQSRPNGDIVLVSKNNEEVTASLP